MSKELDRRIKENAEMKQRVQTLGQFLKTPAARKFYDTADAMSQGSNVHHYSWVSSAQVYLYVVVANLDGFKDPRLSGVIETFEYMNPKATRTVDTPSSFERSTVMEWDLILVNVCGRIKEDSTTCKRIVTEVKHNEPTMIYKFVCDEDQPPAEPVAPTSFPVNQIADVSADLDELTRTKATPEPAAAEPAPDLGDWSDK